MPNNFSHADYLISIIVPVFNVDRFIDECMRSLCAQSDSQIEIVAVDDGSTDDSSQILARFARSDPRVRIYRQENRGLGAARNVGLRLARGDFVTFVDSDDYVSSDYVEKLRACQVLENYDVVSARFAEVTEAGDFIRHQQNGFGSYKLPKLSPKPTPFQEVLGVLASSIACARLIRASLINKHGLGFPDRLPHEDLTFTYKVLYFSHRHSEVADSLYFYRQRQNSLGKGISENHLSAFFYILDDTHAFLEQIDADSDTRALAARRSIVLLNNLKNRADKHRPDLVQEFARRIVEKGSALTEQLDRLESSFAIHLVDKNFIGTMRAMLTTLPAAPVQKKLSKSAFGPELLFIPHKDYHVWTIDLIRTEILQSGTSVGVLDLTEVYKDEGVRAKAATLGIELIPFDQFLSGAVAPKQVVVFNDWEPIVRAMCHVCYITGVRTLAIVEGIQDYDDADTGRKREAYKCADTVVLPGIFDRKYFKNPRQKVIVGAVPRIAELWKQPSKEPKSCPAKKVLINSNFSYGVLEEHRDAWVRMAVEAVLSAGFVPVISRHPADMGSEHLEYQTTLDFYSALEDCDATIQRFASGILESMARRKPVVYFNPHNEMVDKFKDSRGAYERAASAAELTGLLQSDAMFSPRVEKYREFLALHCNLSESDVFALIAQQIVDDLQTPLPEFGSPMGRDRCMKVIRSASENFRRTPPLQRQFPAIYGDHDLTRADVANLFLAIESQHASGATSPVNVSLHALHPAIRASEALAAAAPPNRATPNRATNSGAMTLPEPSRSATRESHPSSGRLRVEESTYCSQIGPSHWRYTSSGCTKNTRLASISTPQTAGRTFVAGLQLKSDQAMTVNVKFGHDSTTSWDGTATQIELLPGVEQTVRLTNMFSSNHCELMLIIDVLHVIGDGRRTLLLESLYICEHVESILHRIEKESINLRTANRFFREGEVSTAMGIYLLLYHQHMLPMYLDNALRAARWLGMDWLKSSEELNRLIG